MILALIVTGQLIITSPSNAGLRLASPDLSKFNVACSTVGSEPKSCEASVNADGSFTASYSDFDDESTGCELQEGGKTFGAVVSNQVPTLETGAGTVDASIEVDADKGDLTTTVDADTSTAVDAAKSESLPATEWETPLSGS